MDDASKAVSDLHNYLLFNKIFLSTDLYNLFKKVDESLYGALVEQQVGKEAEDFKKRMNYYKNTRKEIEPIIREIELFVQTRLHYEKA